MKKYISIFLAISLLLSSGNVCASDTLYSDKTTYTFTEDFESGFSVKSDKSDIKTETWYYGARKTGNPANATFSSVTLDSTGVDADGSEVSGSVLYINGDRYNKDRADQLPASATTENVRTEPVALKVSNSALTDARVSFDFYACNYFYKSTDETTRRDNLTIGFVNRYDYANDNASNPPVSYLRGKSSYVSLQSGFADIGKDAGWFSGATTYIQNGWNHIDIEIANSQINCEINGKVVAVSNGGNSEFSGGFTDLLLYAYYDRGGRWYIDNLTIEYDASEQLMAAKDALSLDVDTDRVCEDIILPAKVNGCDIEWTSSNSKVVSIAHSGDKAVVNRRGVSQNVVLNAKIMINKDTYVNKQFSLTVLKMAKVYPNKFVNVLFEDAFETGISINAGSNKMETGKWYYGTRNKNNVANVTYKTTTAQKENIDTGDYSKGNILDMSAWYHMKEDQLPVSLATGIQPRSEAVVLPVSNDGFTDKVKISLDLYAVNYYYKSTDDTVRRDTFRIALANNYVYTDTSNNIIDETRDTFIDMRNGIFNVNSNAEWNNKFGNYIQNGWNHIDIEIKNGNVYVMMNGADSEKTALLKNPFTHLVMYVPYDQGGRWYADNICVTYDCSDELQEAADMLTLETLGITNADEVTSDLILPSTIGADNYEVEWTSENEAAISNGDDQVRRRFTQETVINAKIKVNENTYINKQFELKVLKRNTENPSLILDEYAIYSLGFSRLSDEKENAITKDIFLPQTGPDNISISWQSTNEAIVGTDGTVNRPHYTQSDEVVTLTAVLKIFGADGELLAEKNVVYENLQVLKEKNPYTMISLAKENIEAQMRENGIDTAKATTSEGFDIFARIVLPVQTGDENTSVYWKSDNETVISASGAVSRGDETTAVTLTSVYEYNGITESYDYRFNVLLNELSMVNKDLAAISFDELNLTELTEDFTVPKVGNLYGSELVWSSNSSFITVRELTDVYKFKVTRPEHETSADTSAILTVTATNGTKSNTRDFAANVVKLPSEAELIADAVEALTFDVIKGINTDEANVTNDLSLVYNMDNDITVRWSSSNPDIINEKGEVFNPPYGNDEERVVLTASVKRSIYSTSQETTFVLFVKPFRNNEELYEKIANSLTFDVLSDEEITSVTHNISLPVQWHYGTAITWSVQGGQGSIEVDNGNGVAVVSRPQYGKGNDVTTLTANINYKEKNITKQFAVTVLEENYLRAEETIWSENCETWSEGTAEFSSSIGIWNMPATDDIPRGTITAQTDPTNENNTVIRIGVDEKNGSGDMRMDLGTEYSGVIVAGMRVFIPVAGVRPTISLRSRGESQCNFSVATDLSFSNSSYFTTGDSQDKFMSEADVIPVGEWFDLRFESDTNMQKYNIFVNDECLTSDGKIQITSNGITTLFDSSMGIPYVYYMSQERNAPIQMLQFTLWVDSMVAADDKNIYVDDLYIKKRVTYTADQLAVGEQYERMFLLQNDCSAITGDLVLPNIKHSSIKISGESSNLSILSNSGKVTRSDTDRTVNWIVNIDDGNNVYKKTFPLIILSSKASSGLTDAEKAQADATEIAHRLKNTYLLSSLDGNIVLPSSAAYGSKIEYSTSNSAVITKDGVVTKGAVKQSAVITVKAIYNDAYAQETIPVTVVKKSDSSSGGGGGSIVSGKGSKDSSSGGYVGVPSVSNVNNTNAEHRYSDVPKEHWAYTAIETLSQKGVISGNGSGNFEPDKNVSREEFVKMIVVALGIPQKGNSGKFTDVKYDSWYNKYISAAVENGIVNGISDDMFGVGINLTRQDLAVMIYRGLRCGSDLSDTKFADDKQIDLYAAEAVYTLYKKGIVNGKSEGYFAPGANATRAEAATMIYRIMNTGK